MEPYHNEELESFEKNPPFQHRNVSPQSFASRYSRSKSDPSLRIGVSEKATLPGSQKLNSLSTPHSDLPPSPVARAGSWPRVKSAGMPAEPEQKLSCPAR